MNSKSTIIGVDIGGTKISAGLIRSGKVLSSATIKTEPEKQQDEILNNLFTVIDDLINNETKAIGVGLPGIIDPVGGQILEITNIPSWRMLKLKQVIQSKYSIPVYIDNDANCFALGTARNGIAQNISNVVALSLGTGLGAGLICNGNLYHGLNNGAGEFGQIPYLDSVFETYCSGQFFKLQKSFSGEMLYSLAMTGDANALDSWNEFGKHLGNMLTTILYSVAPEAIVFGGSVSRGFEFFKPAIEQHLLNLKLQSMALNLKLLVETDENMAVLGAAALCGK